MAYIALFFFISFIALPTIITIIDKDADVSICYSLNEDELQKELKADIILFIETTTLVLFEQYPSKMLTQNSSKHNSVFEEIFSPPPELS